MEHQNEEFRVITDKKKRSEGTRHLDIESSNIDTADYNSVKRLMTVKFLSGAIYEYDDVPPFVFHLFAQAGSQGKAHWRLIRRGNYVYRRIL